MKKLFYLIVFLAHLGWGMETDPIIEKTPLTPNSSSSEFVLNDLDYLVTSIVTETSSSSTDTSTTSSDTSSGGGNSSGGGGSSSGTSSNTCPDAHSDQPQLHFPQDLESFTFPLTELWHDADGDQLAFSISQLNPSSAGQASLSGSVVTVNFNNSGISAGDVVKLTTYANDGECQREFELIINITASSTGTTSGTGGGGNNSGTDSNTTGGNNSGTSSETTGGGNNSGNCDIAFYDGYTNGYIEVNYVQGQEGLASAMSFDNVMYSTSNQNIQFSIVDILAPSDAFNSTPTLSGSNNLLSWDLSGQPGNFEIIVRGVSDVCQVDFKVRLNVDSQSGTGSDTTGGGNNTGTDSNTTGGGDDVGPDGYDCPFYEFNIGPNALIFGLGGEATIDLSSSLDQIGITATKSCEASIVFEIVDEYGDQQINYNYDCEKREFSFTAPQNDYFIIADIYFNTPETGTSSSECIGGIAFDITNDINNLPDDEEGPDGGGPDGGGPDGGGPDGGGDSTCEGINLAFPFGQEPVGVINLDSDGIWVDTGGDPVIYVDLTWFAASTGSSKLSYSITQTPQSSTAWVDASINNEAELPYMQIAFSGEYGFHVFEITAYTSDQSCSESFLVQVEVQPAPEGNNCPYTIPQNGLPPVEGNTDLGSSNINLADFFADPEGDDLSFTVQIYPDDQDMATAVLDGTNLTVNLNGTAGSVWVDIAVSDGNCTHYDGFEIRIGYEVSEGCPALWQDRIQVPISPIEMQLWFPIDYLFDADFDSLLYEELKIEDSSYASLDLGSEDGMNALYFNLPADGPEGQTTMSFEVYNVADGTCGDTYNIILDFVFDQEFYNMILNEGGTGGPGGPDGGGGGPDGGGPDGGGPDGGGPDGGGPDDYDDDCYGNAPYPGDEGWCSADSEIIMLDNYTIDGVVAGDKETFPINAPILSETGIYIGDVFSDNVCAATIVDYSTTGVTLEFTGEPGSTVIVFELRKEGSSDSGDCPAVLAFFLDVNFNTGDGTGPDTGTGGGGPNIDTGGGEPTGPPIECSWYEVGYIEANPGETVSVDLSKALEDMPQFDPTGVTIEYKFYGEDQLVSYSVENSQFIATLPATFNYIGVDLIYINETTGDCYGIIWFDFVPAGAGQGGGGPGDPGDPGDGTGAGTVEDWCEFGPELPDLFIDPADTSVTYDITSEVLALGLGNETGDVLWSENIMYSFSDGEGGSLDLGGGSISVIPATGTTPVLYNWTNENLPNIEFWSHVDIEFYDTDGKCFATIHFNIISTNSSGSFGSQNEQSQNTGLASGGSGGIGAPPTGGPGSPGGAPTPPGGGGDAAGQGNANLGEAPYPGDPNWCSSNTEVIQLPNVITSLSEDTVTTVITDPLLDQAGISIAEAYSDNSSIASINNLFSQNNTLILDVNGPGSVAIVLEVRSASSIAAEDCAAVMFFILNVVAPQEGGVCEVTGEYPPIFVTPEVEDITIDLTPYFNSFGGFEAFSQSFKLEIVDPYLSIGQAELEGVKLTIRFTGQEGFDIIQFQTNDLNGNCLNIVEVPVIVDPNAGDFTTDAGGGFGDGGPGEGGPEGVECQWYELGNIYADQSQSILGVDLTPALSQMPDFDINNVEVQTTFYGDELLGWSIEAPTATSPALMTLTLPPAFSYVGVDIAIIDSSTGECYGIIWYDVYPVDYTTEECIVYFGDDPSQPQHEIWFAPSSQETSGSLYDFFFSPAGNELVFDVYTDSDDLLSLSINDKNEIEIVTGEETGTGNIYIDANDPNANCFISIVFPFVIDSEGPQTEAPPDFNCPQYVEDIWPLWAANDDPREYMLNLSDYFFIPSSGIKYSLLMPEDWGGAIEPFIDIEIDGSFLKVRTDQRYGEVAFQVAYEPLNPSSESTCEVSYIDLMITVEDVLGATQAEFEANCSNTELISVDQVETLLTFELGVVEDIYVDLREYLIEYNSDVDFYIRYDIMFPPMTDPDPANYSMPIVDGFMTGMSDLIIFAPAFEAGTGSIPVEVFDFVTGCNEVFYVNVEVVDNLGLSEIDCPAPLIDFAEFTVQADQPLEINLGDFFGVSGDVSGTTTSQFIYEVGSDRPNKVYLELNQAENKLIISPNPGPEVFGDVFVYIMAADSQEYCETFVDLRVTILPAGVTANECPYVYSEYLDDTYQFPSDQTTAEVYLGEWITDDQSIEDWWVHMDMNPQLDYSVDDIGTVTLYLKEFIPGDVTFWVDAIDPFGCILSKQFVVRVGEVSAEFAFNRCPEITEDGQRDLNNQLSAQGVTDNIIASSQDFVSVDLSGVYSDPDGDQIFFEAFSNNPAIASVGIESSTLTIFYLPQKYGDVSFEFFARDGDPFCDIGQTIHISRDAPAGVVAEVICPELITELPDIEVVQGSALDIIPLSQVFADISTSTFNIFAVSANPQIVEAEVDADKLVLEYASDIDGAASVTVVSSNVSGTCEREISFDVRVVPPAVNLSPVFEPQSITLQENDADETSAAIEKFAATILVSDPEGSALSVTITSGNDANIFDLRENSGHHDLYVIGKLDYEDAEFHELELAASDGENTTKYMYRVNVEDIQNASVDQDFNFTVYDQENESDTASGTTGRIGRNQSYKRFINPRHRQMEVGKWKVRKKITGGADKDLFTINSVEEGGGGPEQRETNMVDVLAFKTPPDYENPIDHNMDNVYEVIVELINEDDGGSEIPVPVTQAELIVPENDDKVIEIQSIGSDPTQDTDGDGIPDVTDNSPLYANPDQADADGDGVGDVTDDDDQDGVWNPNDGCSSTPLGDRVDINGCSIFYLPTNNFTVSKSEKCIGTNSISVGALNTTYTYNYTVSGTTGTDISSQFTGDNMQIENLSAGTYSLCLTVDGIASSVYQRCYTLTITEPDPLSVYSITDPGNNSVTFNLEGGTVYTIIHNGIATQTDKSTYTVSLDAGMNEISITTGIECQGQFATTYFNSSPVDLAPNPFKSSVNLYVGGDDEAVTVTVFDMGGMQVMTMEKVLQLNSRNIEVNTSSLMAGTYIIKIKGATTKQTFVAIKQ
tara:strand:- start:19196 stop:28231 length:9036 start_codon:yes stop_codon:yes gene_type:complete